MSHITSYSVMPIPPVEANTRWFDAGAVRIGVQYRLLDDAIAAAADRVIVTVDRAEGVGAGVLGATVYRGSYHSGQACEGAEPGVVGVDGGAGRSMLVGAGEVFHVVVHEEETGAGADAGYTLRVQGLGACCTACPGDASRDGAIDFDDISAVLSHWLAEYGPAGGPGDANDDRAVDFNDIVAVLTHWRRDPAQSYAATAARPAVCLWYPVSDAATWTHEGFGIDPVIVAGGWQGWRDAYRPALDAIRPGYDLVFLHNPFGFDGLRASPRVDQYLMAPEWAKADFAGVMQGLVAQGHRFVAYIGRPGATDDMAFLASCVQPLIDAGITDIAFDGISHNDPNAGIAAPPVDDPDHAASSFVAYLESLGITVWVETAHAERLSVVDTNWLQRSIDNGWAVAPGSLVLPYPPSAAGNFDLSWPVWFPAWHRDMAERGLIGSMLPYHLDSGDGLDSLLATE